VANEERRFEGAPRTADQERHALQRPVLWGTRRIGPDLSYVGGLYTNDWHAAHFADPRSTTPGSVMPSYTWLFEAGWQVFRTIDPAVAEREGIDPRLRQAIPGVHASDARARESLESVRAAGPELLAADRERLHVDRAKAMNADGLALVAYLQWLGTWKPTP
jgi:cytochrome c oxidase cbb3-type subunit I/II